MWACVATLSILLTLAPIAPAHASEANAVQAPARRTASEVQTLWTNEFGEPHPTGVAYLPRTGEFLAAQVKSRGTRIVRLSPTGDGLGSFLIPRVSDPGTIAFDAAHHRLTALGGQTLFTVRAGSLVTEHPRARRTDISKLGLRHPRAATFAPSRGTWFVLDGASIVRLHTGRSPRVTARIPVGRLGGTDLRGIAFNPDDGLLYVANPARNRLYALTRSGVRKATYPIQGLRIRDLRAMTFAPTADPTDAAAAQDLYIVDNGTSSRDGGVMEARLTASSFSPAASAPTVQASLVQTIDTSQWNPASPDPSGIEYMPGVDRFEVCDSEVEEVTGAGYHGVNMWTIRRNGTVTDTGTTYTPAPNFSKEPTGLGYDPNTNTLFISDDSAKRVWIDKTGSDNRFGTADDVVTSVNAGNFSPASTDTEDPEFQAVTGLPSTGHLFVLDGVGTEIYNVNPVDGIFGNNDDTVTHFDIGTLGSDWEGLGSDPSTGNLLAGERTTRQIFELTPSGTLVRIISIPSASGLTNISGLQMGPASDGSGRMDYWIVDRKVDNGANPNENDGKLYEFSIPSSDNPPTVSITSPSDGATVSGTTTVTANANDDHGVSKVQFFNDGVSIGTDSDPSSGWSIGWNTTTATEGTHVLTAKATDTASQTTTSAAVNVTVDNDSPPTATITSPSNGDTVSGTIQVTAMTTDDHGVTQVQFFNGASSLGTDTNGADGWSVSWDTTAVPDGSKSLTAVATDTANQTGTSPAIGVTVDNLDTPPTVSITSPSENAVVKGTITVTATASDDKSVTQVEFFDGATSIGVDSNGSDGWSVSWTGTDGAHTLTAVATDTKPQTGTSADVHVTVDNLPPTVSISSPTAGSTVTGTISATASADGTGSSVASVQFFNDGVSIGTDSNSAGGWSVQWNTVTTGNGTHNLTATATDAAGNQATSLPVAVTVNNPLLLDIPIATSAGDAEERANATVTLSSPDLDMMTDKTSVQRAVGLRFTGINIPQGATITNAYIQFQVDEKSTGTATLTIKAQAVDNAPAFTATKNNLTNRAQTNVLQTWTPPDWTTVGAHGTDQQTNNINLVIQRVVRRTGWTPGNAIAIIITGSGKRVAESFEGTFAPVLHIEYATP